VGDALGLIGLGLRAGSVVVGTAGVRAGLRRSEFAAVVVASDRSERTDEKVVRPALAREVPVLTGPGAEEMGRRLGRSTVQAVGIRDAKLAAGAAHRLTIVM
jgi:ribosomal protein L7Ae-like RNA K-turn-binding protein